jgi:hypothetical protein
VMRIQVIGAGCASCKHMEAERAWSERNTP